MKTTSRALLLSVLFSVFFTACGGGGGSTSAPPAPVVTPPPPSSGGSSSGSEEPVERGPLETDLELNQRLIAAASTDTSQPGFQLFMRPHVNPILALGSHVYVTNTPNGTVDVIDAETRVVVQQIEVGFKKEIQAQKTQGRPCGNPRSFGHRTTADLYRKNDQKNQRNTSPGKSL